MRCEDIFPGEKFGYVRILSPEIVYAPSCPGKVPCHFLGKRSVVSVDLLSPSRRNPAAKRNMDRDGGRACMPTTGRYGMSSVFRLESRWASLRCREDFRAGITVFRVGFVRIKGRSVRAPFASDAYETSRPLASRTRRIPVVGVTLESCRPTLISKRDRSFSVRTALRGTRSVGRPTEELPNISCMNKTIRTHERRDRTPCRRVEYDSPRNERREGRKQVTTGRRNTQVQGCGVRLRRSAGSVFPKEDRYGDFRCGRPAGFSGRADRKIRSPPSRHRNR